MVLTRMLFFADLAKRATSSSAVTGSKPSGFSILARPSKITSASGAD